MGCNDRLREILFTKNAHIFLAVYVGGMNIDVRNVFVMNLLLYFQILWDLP